MRWLVGASLRLPYLVIAAAAVLLGVALQMLPRAQVDVFPEFAPPLVEIQTECPGLTSQQVEALVTVPLEGALGGLPWLATLRSKSVPGLSSVVLLFRRDADPLRARQLAQERLAAVAPQLPQVARAPQMLPPLSSTSRIMKIGLTSKRLSLVQLSTLVRWTLRPRLMAVPGVANIAVWGQRDRELQVRVDPDELRAAGVSLDQVIAAATDAVAPQPGGFIDTPNQRLGVAHRAAITSAAKLGRVRVGSTNGAPRTIASVAAVKDGHPPLIGEGVINGQLGLLLIVEKQPWANTLQVTRGVERALQALAPALRGVTVDPAIFRPATFIERAISNLTSALLVGCVLVVVVLALFLWQWRTALISTIAIPLSLVGAVLVLTAFGQTINTMVVAGLAIALGEVVDDAIIDVENIVRRLQLERLAPAPRSPLAVVFSASLEVRSAIVYATLIVVLTLAPVLMLKGLSGAFFRPLALSYVLAVLASMLVAMTITPVLALLLLGRDRAPRETPRESPLARALRRRYEAWLPRLVDKPRAVIAGAVLLALLAVGTLPLLGESFLPEFKEHDFLMHWVAKPSTSLPEMRRITLRASKELGAVPGVRSFGAHIGRALAADEVVGIDFAELWISIAEDADYARTLQRVRAIVEGTPGLHRDVLTYLRERVKEVLTGTSAAIVVRLYGDELAVLRREAQRVRAAIASVQGVSDLHVEPQVLIPQIEIEPRLDLLAAFGFTPGALRRTVTTLVQGLKVGEIYQAQKVFNVVVRGKARVRASLSALANVRLDAPSGGQVRLRDIASVRIVAAPNAIKREGASRRIDIACNVAGRDLGAVTRDIAHNLRALRFPRGYHAELIGEHRARQQARSQLLWMVALSLLGVVLLLQAAFRRWRPALLLLSVLPAALAGGVIAVLVGGGATLSLGALVGFVTVLGIAARNGIMLVSHYQHLEDEEGMTFGVPLIVRGAVERLAPILMTALTTALALVPLVVSGDKPGHEIEHPMAIVILGGLLSSLAMNLLLLPLLYYRFGRHAVDSSAEPAADTSPINH